MTCLETSFLINLLWGESGAIEVAESLDSAGEWSTVTPVTAAEVWVGAELGSSTERASASDLIASLTWLEFTRESARLAGEIQADLTRAENAIGFSDCMIAATTMENGEALVAWDSDFEDIEGLNLVTY